MFGNVGTKPGWKTFDPQAHGIEPLSIMAVVCDGKLIYGVWGDTNGDDGAHAMVGEASVEEVMNAGAERWNALQVQFASG